VTSYKSKTKKSNHCRKILSQVTRVLHFQLIINKKALNYKYIYSNTPRRLMSAYSNVTYIVDKDIITSNNKYVVDKLQT